MTDEEIDAMEAGREMDEAIHRALWLEDEILQLPWAGHVLRQYRKPDNGAPHRAWFCLPHYSTDIAAAWLVVEKLVKDTRALRLGYFEGIWWCYAGHPEPPDAYSDSGNGDTTPLAICRAALKRCKDVADKKEDAVEASVNG